MTTAPLRQKIVQGISEPLNSAGFWRERGKFFRAVDGVTHLVELQASSSSTASELIVTVNLEVSVHAIPPPEGMSNQWFPRWRNRLGYLMPSPRDRWWSASSDGEALDAAQTIAQALVSYGLPALERVRTVGSLVELWRAGVMPGLSRLETETYLACLSGGKAG